ncbi:MAG: hypothetical protein Q4C48_07430 [Lachnospiraceae bacterium]|nr:hypothetical protein [Lachnospiraceae bacterium]
MRRILYTLTAMVADGAEAIAEDTGSSRSLTFFSKGKLSIDMAATTPKINLDRTISLADARHLLMAKEISMPLRFSLGKTEDGIVITGTNTGGKTFAMNTVAFPCLMVQSGLHVTCKEADICMNSEFLRDTGDGQNITENLSTFSAHMKNGLRIVESVDCESLVGLDELGSGTDLMGEWGSPHPFWWICGKVAVCFWSRRTIWRSRTMPRMWSGSQTQGWSLAGRP